MKKLNWNNVGFKAKYKSPGSWFMTLFSILNWHALRTHALEQIGWNTSRKMRSAELNGDPIPWWTYSSIQFIDQFLQENASVLEIGGGNSSIFWINRGNTVLTLETNTEWMQKILSHSKNQPNRHELMHIKDETQDSIRSCILDRKFDVVVNDGIGDRTSIAELLLESLRPGGIMVWDNSERLEYADTISKIKDRGWKELSFHGLGPINAYASSTSIFYQGELRIH
jgi:precorrin-6B methylase 2